MACPPPWDLLDPGIELAYLTSLALACEFFATSAIWEAHTPCIVIIKYWLYFLCCPIYPCSLFIIIYDVINIYVGFKQNKGEEI